MQNTELPMDLENQVVLMKKYVNFQQRKKMRDFLGYAGYFRASRYAKYGWYRCDVRFALPISDDKGNFIGKNFFQGRMIIRHAYDDKKYLYDIIDIKKET